MPTQHYVFTGEAVWSKVYEGQVDPKYGHWSIGVVLDPESQINYAKSGITAKYRDHEGKKFILFRRDKQKLINNKIEEFKPVPVTQWDGSSDIPFDKSIGNGSKVAIRVAVYDTRKGPGHRLEAVRVLEWKEYKKPEPTTEQPVTREPADTSKGMPW